MMDDVSAATLQAVIYRLIQQFVKRQTIPCEVIREYRPHLLDWTKRRPTKEYARATYTGRWGKDNEWDYYFHGGGCRLTHTITKEVIEWDAPDLNRFDPYWFVDWLSWFLAHNAEDETASTVLSTITEQGDAFRKKIFEVLEQLYQSGKLSYYPESTNKYELIVPTSSPSP